MASERLALILETVGAGGVIADFKKVSKATGDLDAGAGMATKGLDKLGLSSKISGQALQTGVIAAATIGAAALISFGKSAIQASSGLNEQMAATGVVFGGASDAVVAFSKTTATSLGLSQREALKAANAIGGMFTGLGASEDEAAGASMNLVKLSADLASFKDIAGGAPEVLERLRSGLTGEVEPLRNLGIFLNEATVNAKAAELGFEEVNGKFDDGAKVAARYALIIEQTSDAQGDFARTSESFANQQRTLAAQWEDLQANAGKPIESMAAKLLNAANVQIGALGRLFNSEHDTAAAQKARALQSETDAQIEIKKAKTIEDSAAALKGLRDSVFGLADAERARIDAGRSLDSAQRTLADRQQTLNQLLREGAVDEKAVAAARRDVTAATRDQARALEDQATAANNLAVAQGKLDELLTGKTAAEKGAEAQDDLTAAQLRQRQAVQRQQTAQVKYNEAIVDSTTSAFDLEAATIDLDTANFDLKQANEGVTRAQTDLNKAWQIGMENSPEVIQARKDVGDADKTLAEKTQGVADATQNVKDKHDALGTALAGDPNFKQEVADARQGVADATQAVADASHNVAQQTYDAKQKQTDFNDAMRKGGDEAFRLRNELDLLRTLHPELAPLLAPVLSTLNSALVTAISTGIAGAAPRSKVPINRGGPAVPALAGGGIVTKPMLAHIGEAGPEAVIPLSRGGAGMAGATINVVVQAGMVGDADRVADQLYAALKRLERRNGSLWN